MSSGDDNGYSIDGLWWVNGSWVPTGTWGNVEPPDTKCECGVEKTSGKDYAAEKHSEYCPVYKKWKENEEKKPKKGTGVS